MLPQSSYTIKARTWPIWIISSLIGIPAIFLLITQPEHKAGPYLFIAACLFALLLYGVSQTMKIHLDNECLIYQAYGKKRSMNWKSIKASEIGWSIEGGHGASMNWNFYSFDNKQIHIPLGYYSRSDMSLLANQILQKAKQAKISPPIHKAAKGEFPWYLF